MKTLKQIGRELKAMEVIAELSGAFEGIASMRISQIKNQVQSATKYFDELWQMYSQINVEGKFKFGRSQSTTEIINKELLIAVTAEGGLSGDIDENLITWMLKNYDPSKNDIIVIGHHGAVKLVQSRVIFKKYFKLPQRDQNINVAPLIREVQRYRATTVYYQTYVSLMVQDIKRIELGKAVIEQGQQVKNPSEIINELNYIFEPSTFEVIDHLERSMLQISLSQVILESKLAQYASRFRAMSDARDKAEETLDDISLIYRRGTRSQKDERLKEMVNGLKKAASL